MPNPIEIQAERNNEHSANEKNTLTTASSIGRPFKIRHILSGFLLVILFTSSVTVWSSLAPIEGAVVSPGIVSVAGYRKQIQHLEGGIVDSIYVSDGESVTQGQVLVQLKDVRPSSELRQLQGQLVENQAVEARLLADRDNLEEIVFSHELMSQSDKGSTESVMTGQVQILKSHRMLWSDKKAVLENKIEQTRQEIQGLQGQVNAKLQQRQFIQSELNSIQDALDQHLVPKSEGLKLQQRMAETKGELIAFQADIGRLEQSILEMRLQMSEAQAVRLAGISEDLRENRAQQYELMQKIIAAKDVLLRTKVVSPIDGVVVNLQIHSSHGVVEAGQPLMEVVPANDELVIEVRIDPQDIDEIWAGMPADIRLTSLSRRQRIPLAGTLTGVSADRLTDEQTGEDYYKARVSLTPEALETGRTKLVAGMGADVFLQTGTRTPLDYLLSPITNSLHLGLRE